MLTKRKSYNILEKLDLDAHQHDGNNVLNMIQSAKARATQTLGGVLSGEGDYCGPMKSQVLNLLNERAVLSRQISYGRIRS